MQTYPRDEAVHVDEIHEYPPVRKLLKAAKEAVRELAKAHTTGKPGDYERYHYTTNAEGRLRRAIEEIEKEA